MWITICLAINNFYNSISFCFVLYSVFVPFCFSISFMRHAINYFLHYRLFYHYSYIMRYPIIARRRNEIIYYYGRDCASKHVLWFAQSGIKRYISNVFPSPWIKQYFNNMPISYHFLLFSYRFHTYELLYSTRLWRHWYDDARNINQ